MKKQKPPMSKTEYRKLLAIAYAFMVSGLGLLVASIILMEKDFATVIYVPMFMVALALLMAVLVVLLPNFTRIMEYTSARSLAKMKKGEHIILNGITRARIIEACKKRGFTEKDEYLHKRPFSLTTDYVHYFVGFADVQNGLKNSVNQEIENMIFHAYTSKNVAFVLFLFSEDGKKEDLDWLKDFCARCVNKEVEKNVTTRYVVRSLGNITVVLVDNQTQKGYIAIKPKYGAMFYNKGVRLVKKLTANKK